MSPVLLFGSRSLLSFEYTRPYDKIKWKYEIFPRFRLRITNRTAPFTFVKTSARQAGAVGRFARLRQKYTRSSDQSESNCAQFSGRYHPCPAGAKTPLGKKIAYLTSGRVPVVENFIRTDVILPLQLSQCFLQSLARPGFRFPIVIIFQTGSDKEDHVIITPFASPYDRKHRLCHRYFCRRKSPAPDTSPAGSYHNLWGHGIETPHSCSAELLF